MKKQNLALLPPPHPLSPTDVETLGLLLLAVRELAHGAEGGTVSAPVALATIGAVADVGRMARELAAAAPHDAASNLTGRGG